MFKTMFDDLDVIQVSTNTMPSVVIFISLIYWVFWVFSIILNAYQPHVHNLSRVRVFLEAYIGFFRTS